MASQGCTRSDDSPDAQLGFDSGAVNDAGPAEGGLDAGPEDSGSADAGGRDAGPPDTGPPDAGPPDAGPPVPTLVPTWIRQIPGEVEGVGVDGVGRIVVAGVFSGTVDFGTGSQASAGAGDVFVLSLDADGSVGWVGLFGGASTDNVTDLSVDADGNISLVGYTWSSTIDFGTGPLPSEGTSRADAYVARFNASGTALWAHRIGASPLTPFGAVRAQVMAVHATADGSTTIGGRVEGAITFGSGALDSSAEQSFFATLDAAGTPTIVVPIEATGLSTLTRDGVGNTTVGISYGVRFRAFSDAGMLRWSSETDNGSVNDMASAPDGRIFACGSFDRVIDFDPFPLRPQYRHDGYAIGMASDGTVQWARRFASLGEAYATSMADDEDGNLWVAGTYRDRIQLGTDILSAVGLADIFAVVLAPDGAVMAGVSFGGPLTETNAHVASGTGRIHALTGNFSEPPESELDFLGLGVGQGFVFRLE